MIEKPQDIRYRRDIWKVCLPGGGAAEIGVAEGNFAEDILRMPIQFPKVYLVDRWRFVPIKGDSGNPQIWHDRNHAKVVERTRQFGRRVEILKLDSHRAAELVPDGSLSLINVDGDHSYEGVKRDLEHWWRKLLPGGVMCFHDFEATQYGVKRAVTEWADRNLILIHKLPEDSKNDAGAFLINPKL